jgi:molecular chaperone GrpE (heat shock protein)
LKKKCSIKERRKKLNGETPQIKDQEQGPGPEPEKIDKHLEANEEMVPQSVQELQEKVAELEGQVVAKTNDVTGLEDRLARVSQDVDGARAAYACAVEDYKKLAASSNPLVPVEAISGTTIEEVKDSLGRALKLVSSVQESLAKQAQASSVPAGAPARAGSDISAMSTKEKINYGLEQARRKKEQ